MLYNNSCSFCAVSQLFKQKSWIVSTGKEKKLSNLKFNNLGLDAFFFCCLVENCFSALIKCIFWQIQSENGFFFPIAINEVWVHYYFQDVLKCFLILSGLIDIWKTMNFSPHGFMKNKWYFVTIIVLTYCEKKLF